MLEIVSNRYRILEQAGSGGMSDVYKALDTKLDQIVALKVLKEEYWKSDEQKLLFEREAKAVQKLSHKNIVRVYATGSDGDMRYIVMEYVESTLRDIIKPNTCMRWRDAVKYALKILAALDHAHKKQIIHRDIKPENILVDSDSNVKVTDFGIARFLGGKMGTISSEDKIFGSARYMSPEQALNETATERSDLYSLGIVLYEMLTGHVPFDADSPSVILSMQVNEIPVGVRAFNKDVPPAIEQVVMTALEKEPRLRYASAVDMADALQKAMKRQRAGKGFDRVRRYFTKNGSNAVLVTASLITVLFIIIYGFVRVSDILYGVDVPSMIGKGEKEALELADEVDMRAQVEYVFSTREPEGQVISQQPAAGTRSRRNRQVALTVSKGAEPVYLPDTLGKDRQEAQKLLSDYGFPTVNPTYTYIPGEKLDTVVAQYPNNGSARPGTTISLTINSQQLQVPALTGMKRQQAIDTLEAMGLNWEISTGYSTDASPDTVLMQDPPVGMTVLKGSTVSLAVTLQNPEKYLASFNLRVPLKMHVRIVLVTPSGEESTAFDADCDMDRIIALELESSEPGTHEIIVYYDEIMAVTHSLVFI